jgi:hypothetical protein
MAKPKIEVLFSLPAARAHTLEGEITFQVFQVHTGKSVDVAKGWIQTLDEGRCQRLIVCSLQEEIIFSLDGTAKHKVLDDALVYLSSLYTTVDTVVLPHAFVLNSVALGARPLLEALKSRLQTLNRGFREVVAATALAIHNGSKTVDVPTVGVVTLPVDVCFTLQKDTKGQKQEILKFLQRELEETTGYTYAEILQMRKRLPKDSGLEID